MNSFKKIALGLVAAITLGTLVASPASANTGTLTLTVGGNAATGGTTVASPVALPVPADNAVHSADALRIAVTNLLAGTVVNAVATNGRIVTATHTDTATVNASAGSNSVSINTGTGTTADLFIYTTTTAVGSVSVTIGANTTTYYFQGTAGALNTIAVEAPTSGAAGTTATLKVLGYDVFGNAKGGSSISLQYITPSASTTYSLTTDTASATVGTKTQDVTLPASGSVTIVATATVASAVTGLAAPLGVVVRTATVRDLAAELAAKNAEVASLTAQLAAERAANAKAVADAKAIADAAALKAAAELTTANAEIAKLKAEAVSAKVASDKAIADIKAAFNSLAKKWNAKNPRARVATLK